MVGIKVRPIVKEHNPGIPSLHLPGVGKTGMVRDIVPEMKFPSQLELENSPEYTGKPLFVHYLADQFGSGKPFRQFPDQVLNIILIEVHEYPLGQEEERSLVSSDSLHPGIIEYRG